MQKCYNLRKGQSQVSRLCPLHEINNINKVDGSREMKTRWIMLLVAGILSGMVVGCGNRSTTTSEQEVNESIDETEDELEENDTLDEEDSQEEASVVFTDADLTCTLPKGFEAQPDEPGLYVHKTYPTDSSTISYVISESDYDISDVSKEEFKQDLEEDFYVTYGDQIDVNITQYEKITVDGRNGLRIMMTYEFKGVEYEQLMYMLYNGNESHILNFTQEQGGKWMDEFEKCGETIAFTN